MAAIARRSIPLMLLATLAALLAAQRAVACHNWPFTRPGDSERSQKVYAKLEEMTSFEFIETPLRDVVDYFKDLHDIEIQIDQLALDDTGIDTSPTITSKMKDVPLCEALDRILAPLDLTYSIRDEVLLITTLEHAAKRPEVRIYNVAELLDPQTTAQQLADAVHLALGPSRAYARTHTATDGDKRVADPQNTADKPEVKATTEIVGVRNVLVVRDTVERHGEVCEILLALRAAIQGPDKVEPKRQQAPPVKRPKSKRKPAPDKDENEENPFAP